jgi:hypothetical protein
VADDCFGEVNGEAAEKHHWVIISRRETRKGEGVRTEEWHPFDSDTHPFEEVRFAEAPEEEVVSDR